MNLRPVFSAINPARAGWRTLVLCLFMVACGGGVESGGTGGSIEASYVSGPITGFGSVIVGGVRFDDSSASLSVTDADGTSRSRDDLKLGMTINVRGAPIATDDSSVASSIVYGSAIVGPITLIDTTASRLTVLGQLVDVLPTTVFDTSLSGAINALVVGDVIEVYGLFDPATQRYSATRIERKASASLFRLRGVVTNLDTIANTFMVGAERISYAALPGLPAGLVNGSIVRIDLQTTQDNGVRAAARLSNGVTTPQNRDEVRIEGLISAFMNSRNFSVDGVRVDASAATFPNGEPAAPGVRVAVRGAVNNGALSATRVDVKSQSQVETDGFQLRGLITSDPDRVAQTFVLRGVTVSYAGTVEFNHGTALDLAIGKNVEARGRLSADGTHLVAVRIDFK